jgi:DNA-binding GntR family transcriptional regulator
MLQTLYVINPDSPEHTYVQLADLIEAEIRAGKLRGKIRAERDLAEEYGVAYTTVRRAMAVLRERGLIKSIQGRGTFVIQPGD